MDQLVQLDQVVVELEEEVVLLEELEQLILEVVVEAGGPGGAGGSGIVVVRVPGSTGASVAPGTNSIATLPGPAGGCKVASFTVTGTLTIS